MADIFISYAQVDRERVRRIVDALSAEGFDVWWDALIEPGQAWEATIDLELEAAKAVVVVWSENSVDRFGTVCNEARYAERMGKLCTLHIDQVSPPTFFQHLHSENLVGWRGEKEHPGYRKVLARAASLSRRAGLKPDPALLTLGERLTRLEGLSWGYGRRINGFLDWLERNVDGGHPPSRGLWLRSFTPGLLNLTLLLAVVYPIIFLAVQWIVTGQESQIGEFVAFNAQPQFWSERAILFGALCVLLLAPIDFDEHGPWVVSIGVILVFGVAGAGVVAAELGGEGAYLVVGIVFFRLLFNGLYAFGNAFVFAVVFASVGGDFFSAVDPADGVFVQIFSVFGPFLIGLIGVGAALSLSFSIGGAAGIPGVAFGGFLACLLGTLLLALWGHSALGWAGLPTPSGVSSSLLLFLAILPLINALFDFCSIGLTRYLLRKGAREVSWRTLDYAALDLLLGALLFMGLGCASIAAIHFLRTADGQPLLNLAEIFTDIAQNPEAYWWLYATFFSTLLPTIIHVVIVGAAFADIFVRGASDRAKRALLIAQPPELETAIRSGVIRTWIAQAFGLLVGVAFSVGLIYFLAFGWGSAIASAMFDVFILFAQSIGAIPMEWVRPT